MEVCTYQSVACSTTMWGEEEDSLLFIYMRVALGNGRTDASSVVYVRRTPSELPSARDRQPADRHPYIHGPWSRRNGFAGRERERETYRTNAPQNTSLVPTTHFTAKTPLPRLNVASSKLFFRIIILVSYLIFRLEMGRDKSEGRSGKKYIDIVSDRELQTPSQACRKNWEMWEMWKWHGRILQDSYRL